MMKIRWTPIQWTSLLLLALPLVAQAKSWSVIPAQSTLGFSGSYQGGAFHGTFKQFTARIDYDPAHLDAARFDVSVDLASVNTQNSERDQSLTGGDFFAVAKFPKAHFVTQSFTTGADGRVTAHGTLTLRGITKPVLLQVQFKRSANGATLDVGASLNRLDFKLGTGGDWKEIAVPVTVHGHLILK